jgi:hypothetical protein
MVTAILKGMHMPGLPGLGGPGVLPHVIIRVIEQETRRSVVKPFRSQMNIK